MVRSEQCHFCGGEIRRVSGAGRWHDYRGVRCELPHDLAVRVCQSCGRDWMSDADVSRMSDSFERQRIDAERARAPVSVRTSRPSFALVALAVLAPVAVGEAAAATTVWVTETRLADLPNSAIGGADKSTIMTITPVVAAPRPLRVVEADATGVPS